MSVRCAVCGKQGKRVDGGPITLEHQTDCPEAVIERLHKERDEFLTICLSKIPDRARPPGIHDASLLAKERAIIDAMNKAYW